VDPKQAEPTRKKQTKRRLTFDPLLLRLEGLARIFGRLLQAKDRSLLLLDSLAQILMGDDELVQLPVEPRDFFIPLLECRLCPLECGTLLLESALGFFPRQTLVLEGGLSLSKGGLLLLELSLRLAARILLLLEPLLRRGEGGSLVRQGGPQLLDLLGLLLGLALPSTHSLEDRAVLLELGTSSGHLHLPLRHHGPRSRQILTRFPQCLIPLQECHPHLRDSRGVFCSPSFMLQELVMHGLDPIL
jgi:hypothetical protein